MQKNRVRFWHSLVSRFGFFFLSLLVLAIAVSGYLVYTQSARVITEYSKEETKHTTGLARQSFYALLGEVSNDIAVTSESPVISNFLSSPSPENTDAINRLFKTVLVHKPNYFQIRLLDINQEGKEVIRFDKTDSTVTQVAEQRLQYKSSKLYFQEAIRIDKGEFYFSAINLNEEYGVISTPHTPTVRAACKIYDKNDNARYLLIINVDLSVFFNKLRGLIRDNLTIVLCDTSGQYLFANDPARRFGKQLKHKHTFLQDFGENVNNLAVLNQNQILSNDNTHTYYFHLEKLPYFQGRRTLYLVALEDENHVLLSANRVRYKSLLLILAVSIVALIVALLFAGLFSRRITRVTNAIASYPDISHTTVMPKNSRDELGVLVKTFDLMQNKINSQMQALKVSLQKEKTAIKERDEFLQNMSHELRTPLNSILGLTKLLSKNKPTTHQKPIIEALIKSSQNLKGLMYDVLDFQKLKEGKLQLILKPVNIQSILKDIYTTYHFVAIQKGIALELQTDNALQKNQYMMDAIRLSQMVTNLVVNAITYTTEGKVTIVAKITPSNELWIAIIDSGKGMHSKELKNIKDRFYRGEFQPTPNSGYGLGLSIVQQLTDLFKGSFTINSQIGKGSTCTLQLPVKQVNINKAEDPSSLEGSWPQFQDDFTIVHLEDDKPTQLLVSHLLEKVHCTLVQVNSINEVETYCQNNNVHLLITDLMIDNRFVGNTISSLKVLPTKSHLLVVSALDKVTIQAISPWALQKPFSETDFLSHVFVLLGRNLYTYPSFKNSYAQYDHDSSKIDTYLSLLIREFNEYRKKCHLAVADKDQTKWEAIRHKIITHIHALELKEILPFFPHQVSKMNNSKLFQLSNLLAYYTCCFRVEQYINSAN